MKTQIAIATILYIVLVAILEAIIDIERPNSTFEKIGVMLIVSSILGYILNSYILSQKFNTEKKLLHITKEIIHELKIPIATIRANIALIRREAESREPKIDSSRLERIKNSIIRLERLYQELVYSIEKGDRDYSRKAVAARCKRYSNR